VGDVNNNLNRADAVLNKANPDDLDLLVLPEMAFSGKSPPLWSDDLPWNLHTIWRCRFLEVMEEVSKMSSDVQLPWKTPKMIGPTKGRSGGQGVVAFCEWGLFFLLRIVTTVF
jgi:hypothetical protein